MTYYERRQHPHYETRRDQERDAWRAQIERLTSEPTPRKPGRILPDLRSNMQ